MDDDGNFPDASGGGGADGQDMCSFFHSVFAHRESMVRLINWLRNSQTTCTDTNCFDDINGGLPGPEQADQLTDQANPLFGSDTEGRDRRFELQMRKNNEDNHRPGGGGNNEARPAL